MGTNNIAPIIHHYDNAPDNPQVVTMVRYTPTATYEVWQNVSGLIPDQECTFSFYYRFNSLSTNDANLLFKIGGIEEASVNTADGVNWTQESGTFTPTAGTMIISFSISNDGYTFYAVDDVEVRCPVPPGPCTECIPGFFVSEGSCVSCSQTYGPECNKCDESECTGCADSFYLNSDNECVTCEEKFEYCKKCSSDGDECKECAKGYKFIDGACVYNDRYSGQYTCDIFMDDFHCEWCKSGCFWMNYHCYPMISSCDGYYDNGMCDVCKGGHRPRRNRC